MKINQNVKMHIIYASLIVFTFLATSCAKVNIKDKEEVMKYLNTWTGCRGGAYYYEDNVKDFKADLKPTENVIHQNIFTKGVFLGGTDYPYEIGDVSEKGREILINGLSGNWYFTKDGNILFCNEGHEFLYKYKN
ncbi:MAG: hypothetical protein WCL06_01160 [Bacteroidota bacterium]